MKLCIFNSDRIGIVTGESVVDVTDAFEGFVVPKWPYPKYDWLIHHFPAVRESVEKSLASRASIPLNEISLKASVANPGKIIGAPINYRDHIAEANADAEINHGKTYDSLDRFGLFLKANSSLIGPSEAIIIPNLERRTDHEIELAVVIGKMGSCISEAAALDHVFGYCIGLDITVRGPEFPGFRKSPDTFSVLGPWIVTRDEIPDPNILDLELELNGARKQQSNTRHLIFNVQKLIAYASRFYTLFPGDVIMTGTPSGVGPIRSGDLLKANIQSIGEMTVRVAQSAESRIAEDLSERRT